MQSIEYSWAFKNELGKGELSHIHWNLCWHWIIIECNGICTGRSVHPPLEWFRIRRVYFLCLVQSFSTSWFWRLWKARFFVQHGVIRWVVVSSAYIVYVHPSNNVWASTRTIHGLAAQSSDTRLCRTIHLLSLPELWAWLILWLVTEYSQYPRSFPGYLLSMCFRTLWNK